MQLILPALTSFCFCLLLVPVAASVAPHIGLMDLPDNGRKDHGRAVPNIGGISIFIAVAITTVLFHRVWPLPSEALALQITGGLIVLFGAADDALALGARLRLLQQLLCVIGLVLGGGMLITTVGNIAGGGAVNMHGAVALGFTVICVLGVINAINMIDGADGLCGGIVLISVLALALVAYQGDATAVLVWLMLFAGALLGFLFFNARVFRQHAFVFLGDAGSTLLGLLLAWAFVKLSQPQGEALSAVAAGWIFGLPLLDTVSVMVERMRNGQSPLRAGADHIHHRLLQSGLKVGETVRLLLLVHCGFVIVGLMVNQFRGLEPFAFWLFVLLVITHHFKTPRAIQVLAARRGASRGLADVKRVDASLQTPNHSE